MQRHAEPTSSGGAPSLLVKDVRKSYGDVIALAGVTLEARGGELLALVGESGSGKTTLLRCVNRLVQPDGGHVAIGGQAADTLDAVSLRRAIGYVPQTGGLLPHWRVGRNVELVPRLLGRQDAAAESDAALRLVGLPPERFRHRWPHELSGGQRQRVAIARALAARPRLILLDEPFGALDAITRADLQASFAGLRLGADGEHVSFTSLLVTHDLHEAFLLADRIAVLRAGRVEQVATPRELLEQPATPYVGTLLTRARVTSASLAERRVQASSGR